VRKVIQRTRWSLDTEWTAAADLCPGDEIILHDHGDAAEWPGAGVLGEGYVLGLLLGDGTIKADKTVLSAWPGRQAVHGGAASTGVHAVMRAAEDAVRGLGHRADFSGWIEVPERGEYRLSTAALRTLAERYGMRYGTKRVTSAIERSSAVFHRGFLRGLFDADGSVQGGQEKGVSVRLAQSSIDTLEAAQRMLLRLGIVSTLYRNRRPEGWSTLPDGKGGQRDYPVRGQHELVISGANLIRFAARVGFEDTVKRTRLKALIGGYQRAVNRERFVARVASIDPHGVESVFDATVPGVHCFDANGIQAHNCGEQPLPPYGACLLGSINLARLVERPFAATAALDLAALDALVPVAVRMLDNVVDISRFPLPEQAAEARDKRRIGLGVTGLADALIMCGARYGSADAVRLTETWMRAIRDAAYRASVDLAREKGAFPLFDRDRYLAGESVAELPDDIRAGIAAHGIRNALLTSVAPTGTISLLADNVSSGLEPVFAFSYERTVLEQNGLKRVEPVTDHAFRMFRRLKGEAAALPDAFVTAQTLRPEDHVVMQAAVQKYVDSSISKTINCPEDIAFEAFKDIYRSAYESGCKGCTTYRPNPVTGSVLAVTSQTPSEAAVATGATGATGDSARRPAPTRAGAASGDGKIVRMMEPLDRPADLPGKTYKIKWPESDHAMYITLNDIVQDGRRRPFEIFINSKNMEHFAWTVALTRMISAVFRRGGDVSFVVEELKAVFDPRGGAWMERRYVPSLLAAIGGVIEEHMIATGFLKDPDTLELDFNADRKVVGLEGVGLGQCPKCGAAGVLRQEGCDLCTSCGYSKCG
jgi:ribonucleoside-diphosphate reductase alpha chain